MPPKKPRADGDTLVAENRRARHDYDIGETVECGLVLVGAEVKALRLKAVSFTDAYGMVKNDELFLIGLKIDRWRNASTHTSVVPDRPRKLLASKREIEDMRVAISQQGATVVPMRIYFKGPWAKILVGIGTGKTHGDKRQDIKKREADRDMARAISRHGKR
jgi:SsrA-binding protein